jgi:hypothetical protein
MTRAPGHTSRTPERRTWTAFSGAVWADANQQLHIDIPALLRVAGAADTPRNRELLTDAARELVRQEWPGMPVSVLGDS